MKTKIPILSATLMALYLLGFTMATKAQTTFASPGQESCTTTTSNLADRTASDGVTISPYRWVTSSCIDVDLFTISVNDCQRQPYVTQYPECNTNGAYLRRPTFCYNNGYFPTTSGYPLAIAQNLTANSGNCMGGTAHVVADFSSVTTRPKGLTFTINDIDNPYDSIQVLVYSNGNPVTYNFAFGETDPANSYVWSDGATGTTGSGSSVGFGSKTWGDANGWASFTPDANNAKGVINFTVDPAVYVDSVVVIHKMRNDRPDSNPAFSIGNFVWQQNVVLPVVFGPISATITSSGLLSVNWVTLAEHDFKSFDVEASKDGGTFTKIGSVGSKSANGNSSLAIQYQFNKNISGAIGLLGLHYFIIPIFILFLISIILAMIHKKRKQHVFVSIFMGILFTIGLFACNKNEKPGTKGNDKIYIRIVTHDINGATSQSKVIQALQE